MGNNVIQTNSYIGRVRNGWSEAWTRTAFRWQFTATILAIASFPYIFFGFFDFVEGRQGIRLEDPFLNIIPAHNVSWTIFFFLYLGVFIGIGFNLQKPRYLLLTLQTYLLVTLVRLGTITLFPLEPPVGYIPLREPIVQMVTNGGKIISKDLFFSGHVSTILSLYLTVYHKQFRPVLLMFVLMISLGVLVQHVHYTIDVLAAPLGTWLCYKFSQLVLLRQTE